MKAGGGGCLALAGIAALPYLAQHKEYVNINANNLGIVKLYNIYNNNIKLK